MRRIDGGRQATDGTENLAVSALVCKNATVMRWVDRRENKRGRREIGPPQLGRSAAMKKRIERIEACEVGSQRNVPWIGARSTKSITSSLPQTLTFIPPCSPTVSMKANRAATRVSRPVVVRAR